MSQPLGVGFSYRVQVCGEPPRCMQLLAPFLYLTQQLKLKTMKKIMYLSKLLLTVFLLSLTSCGDDNNGTGSSTGDVISKAIGTWMCIQSTDTQQGSSYYGMMVGKEVTVYANGTYSSTSTSFGLSGTYSASGNKITAHSDGGATFVVTVTFNGDYMEWNGTASNGVTFRYVFQRESSSSNPIDITSDMIDEKYSFEVESFNITRGSNSNIQKGKTIRFKNDGSCEAFHSMETAWRINNGRIETYYKATNEPMYVYTLLSTSDDNVTIKMNGTLDSNLEATIVFKRVLKTEAPSVIVEESFFNNLENVKLVRNGCYANLASFEDYQIKLEDIRLNTNKVHTINANTTLVNRVWESAYKTISQANTIIEGIKKSEALSAEDVNGIVAEIRTIRAFVYYNIAMLWGNVPLVTSSTEANVMPSQATQNDVLQFAYSEISSVVNDLPVTTASPEGNLAICRLAGYLLQAEIAMTLGNKTTANSILSNIGSSSNGETIIWGFKTEQTASTTPIYTNKHISLYKDEASNNTSSLLTDWANASFTYGYCAALKRLGQAQAVTECYNYELLMPIPDNVINLNKNFTQNPGY